MNKKLVFLLVIAKKKALVAQLFLSFSVYSLWFIYHLKVKVYESC